MAIYSGDPRWITARYGGTDKDGNQFKAGDRVYWFPRTKTIYAGKSAERESARFEAERFDEAMITGNW